MAAIAKAEKTKLNMEERQERSKTRNRLLSLMENLQEQQNESTKQIKLLVDFELQKHQTVDTTPVQDKPSTSL